MLCQPRPDGPNFLITVPEDIYSMSTTCRCRSLSLPSNTNFKSKAQDWIGLEGLRDSLRRFGDLGRLLGWTKKNRTSARAAICDRAPLVEGSLNICRISAHSVFLVFIFRLLSNSSAVTKKDDRSERITRGRSRRPCPRRRVICKVFFCISVVQKLRRKREKSWKAISSCSCILMCIRASLGEERSE